MFQVQSNSGPQRKPKCTYAMKGLIIVQIELGSDPGFSLMFQTKICHSQSLEVKNRSNWSI